MARNYYTVTCCSLFVVSHLAYGQSNNVGIGTSTPTEKLEVSGIVYTNTGGFRFPDMTLQETAAFNSDPENGSTPNGEVYLTISTTNPPIPDTMRIVDVSQGGVMSPVGGGTNKIHFTMLKEMDIASRLLFQKCVLSTTLTKARLHFTDANGALYQTIELRDAELTKINYRDVYQGNGTYAHLEELEFEFTALEVLHDGDPNDFCYCWNFAQQMTCTCDGGIAD